MRGRSHLGVAALLAGGAGAAWFLAAPPRDWWPLFPVGVAALAVAVYGRSARQRALLGALYGVGAYVPGLWWLTGFSVPGYVVVTVFEIVLLAVAVAILPAGRARRWSGGWWALPAVLVLMEAVQARIPFEGFPLPSVALSQAGGPFAMAAPLGGSLLVTVSAATIGVGLAALFVVDRRRRALAWERRSSRAEAREDCEPCSPTRC